LTLNSDGTVLGISGSLTDVTERKQAETAIQKLAAFPQVNPNPVLEFAADGTLTYANDAARAMAKSLGKDDLPSILRRMPGPWLATAWRPAKSGCAKKYRQWANHYLVLFPRCHQPGRPRLRADVTDMLNLEAQFRHAQKLNPSVNWPPASRTTLTIFSR